MIVKPKKGILLIKKHTQTALKADIATIEDTGDKRLITGEVVSSFKDSEFPKGSTVVFGKYALFPLTLQGENYNLLDEKDVIATCDYRE